MEEDEEELDESGYSYCPVCEVILPVPEDLNQDVVFQRIYDHIGTHSTWQKIKTTWRLKRWDRKNKLRRKSS